MINETNDNVRVQPMTQENKKNLNVRVAKFFERIYETKKRNYLTRAYEIR